MSKFKTLLLSFVFLLMGATVLVAGEQQDIDLVRQRYVDFLLESTPDEAVVQSFLKTLDVKTGAFSDIDYESDVASEWRTKQHAFRAAELAKFYYSGRGSKLFTKKDLFAALNSVMEYWYREKPYCTTNWYGNKIYCPAQLGYALLLMQGDMTEEQMKKATDIVFEYVSISMNGSNKLLLSNNVLIKGILTKDAAPIKEAIDAIVGTIYVADQKSEGIQADFSYHFHGPQQQFGNYGMDCLNILSIFCNLLYDTSFAFSPEKQDVLSNYVSQGYRWVIYKGVLDLNGSGRQYGPDMIKNKINIIFGASQRVYNASTEDQKAQIAAMFEENKAGNPVTLIGQKHFFCSDGISHRRADWAASLKMHSLRVLGTERVNEDNLKGFYSADGAFYTYVDGDEYNNAVVLWDWRKVPGITCYETNTKIKRPSTKMNSQQRRASLRNIHSFVGACTDGTRGMGAMVLNRDSLWAKKAWVITEDFALCLGADIRDSIQTTALTTSIEQKNINGTLEYLDGKKWKQVKRKMTSEKKDLRFYNYKTGYIVLDGEQTEALVEERTEDWFNISNGLGHNVVTDDVLSIFIRHNTQGATYQYLILPAKTKEQVANFDVNSVKVLSNTADLQLVEIDGQYYATAYGPTQFKNADVDVKFVTGGIFMFKKEGGKYTVIAHDPTQGISDTDMTMMISVK